MLGLGQDLDPLADSDGLLRRSSRCCNRMQRMRGAKIPQMCVSLKGYEVTTKTAAAQQEQRGPPLRWERWFRQHNSYGHLQEP